MLERKTCPICGRLPDLGENYCGKCGAKLEEVLYTPPPPDDWPPREPREPIEAERMNEMQSLKKPEQPEPIEKERPIPPQEKKVTLLKGYEVTERKKVSPRYEEVTITEKRGHARAYSLVLILILIGGYFWVSSEISRVQYDIRTPKFHWKSFLGDPFTVEIELPIVVSNPSRFDISAGGSLTIYIEGGNYRHSLGNPSILWVKVGAGKVATTSATIEFNLLDLDKELAALIKALYEGRGDVDLVIEKHITVTAFIIVYHTRTETVRKG